MQHVFKCLHLGAKDRNSALVGLNANELDLATKLLALNFWQSNSNAIKTVNALLGIGTDRAEEELMRILVYSKDEFILRTLLYKVPRLSNSVSWLPIYRHLSERRDIELEIAQQAKRRYLYSLLGHLDGQTLFDRLRVAGAFNKSIGNDKAIALFNEAEAYWKTEAEDMVGNMMLKSEHFKRLIRIRRTSLNEKSRGLLPVPILESAANTPRVMRLFSILDRRITERAHLSNKRKTR